MQRAQKKTLSGICTSVNSKVYEKQRCSRDIEQHCKRKRQAQNLAMRSPALQLRRGNDVLARYRTMLDDWSCAIPVPAAPR